MNFSQNRKYLFALLICLVVVVACLIVLSKITDPAILIQVNLSPSTYISFFLSVALIYLVSLFLWTQFSHLFGQPRGEGDAFIDTGLLAIGKYIPGKIWGMIARGAVSKKGINISRKQVSVSVLEQGFTLGSGLVLVIILMASIRIDVLISFWVPLVALLLLATVALYLTWGWITRTFDISGTRYIHARLFFLSIGYMLMWCVSTLPLIILLNSQYQLSPSEIIHTAAAFISSMICGWLAIFTPGGLGIREIVFSYISPATLTWQEGLFWITLHRALYTFFDLVYGSLTLALIAIRRRTANATN